jgi:hypothetical protein
MSGANLYGQEEVIQKETVKVENAMAGQYTAVVGKTYNLKGKKREAIVTDFFLVMRSKADMTDSQKLMELANVNGKTVLKFHVTSEGKPKTSGVLFLHRNNAVLPEDSEGFKNMSGSNRRKMARVFGAFDETTQQIDWKKIQSMAGRFVTFTLEERGDYLNMDLKSLALLENGQVSLENLVDLYTAIEEEKQAKMAEKMGAPAGAASISSSDLPF